MSKNSPAEALSEKRASCVAVFTDTAQRHVSKIGEAVAYTWTDEQGRPRAMGWVGRSVKPWARRGRGGFAFWFKTQEQRRAWVAEMFAEAAAKVQRKTARSEEKAAVRASGHNLTVGDILRASWGYDQTNIDFFEVTALIGSQTVEYREIAQQREHTGDMNGLCVPCPGQYIGEAKRARVSDYVDSNGKRESIKADGHHASRVSFSEVQGVRVYAASSWSAWA